MEQEYSAVARLSASDGMFRGKLDTVLVNVSSAHNTDVTSVLIPHSFQPIGMQFIRSANYPLGGESVLGWIALQPVTASRKRDL